MNKRQGNIIFSILFAGLLLVNGAAMAQRSGDQHVSVGGKVFGGGKKANVSGSSTVMIDQTGAIVGSDVYGGGEMAKVNTTDGSSLTNGKSTHVTLRVGTVQGSLYGGGLGVRPSGDDPGTPADVFGPVQVTINGGTVVDNVFGCNNLFGAPQTTVVVDVLKDPSNVIMSLQNVYGGGNQAAYSNSGNNYPEVNIKHGTVGGSVFGGGLGVTATVTGNPQVTIGDNVENHTAVVSGKVYGGGDEAAVIGSTTVTVQNAHSRVGVDVYGGGNQANVSNSTTVHINNGTIGQDVYGGGAFAHVGTDGDDNTTVNVLGGTVTRDVYGGGLGRKEEGQQGETGYVAPIAAAVNGVVTVNIGALTGALENGFAPSSSVTGSATIGGSVFGCNNSNGTPKDNVTVHIYKTAHTTGVNTVSDQGFAIAQVFGGGNQAHYEPTSTNKKATVHVWTCDNTIQYLYGGGNAADVGTEEGIGSATDVIIDGGRIEWVFGGGNGAGNDNPGANIYGNVGVSYHAGIITYLFGGSNEKGDITGSKTVSVLNDGPCVGNQITELYGGSNLASLSGDIDLTMSCHPLASNCQIGTIFGGSRNADVDGNVTLTIEGGLYNYAFGGNNIGGTINGNVTLNLYGGTINEAAFGGNKGGGSITGDITVKVEDHCTCPLEVKDVFGAGDQAMYTAPTGEGVRENNPIVYVNNLCTVEGTPHTITGNVYGGGNGDPTNADQEPGMVTGNPQVIVGDLTTGHESYRAAISGNVYGGGNAAKVVGTTTVLMQKDNSTVGNDIYGGGNLANVSGSTTVNVTGGTVTQDVYGGGALANTGGSNVTLDGGSVRDIYGGGLGRLTPAPAIAAQVTGPVHVTVNGGTVRDVFGCNNLNGAPTSTVQVDINNNVTRNVYGGGNHADYDGKPVVNIIAGTVSGNVYGGGNDITDGTKGVKNSDVEMTGGIVLGGVYGGCNLNGTVTENSEVKIYGGTVGSQEQLNASTVANVFGGGLGQNTNVNGNVTVTVDKGDGVTIAPTIYGDVYGGSAFGSVNTDGNNTTTVNIMDGMLMTKRTSETLTNGQIIYYYTGGNVYGGGLGQKQIGNDPAIAAVVKGVVTVNIGAVDTWNPDYPGFTATTHGNATIGGNIYGCNNANGSPEQNVTVNVYATAHTPENEVENGTGYAIPNVFGGGNEADYTAVDKTAAVNIYGCDNTIERTFGGGNAAAAPHVATFIQGGRFSQVFGGGNGERGTSYGANINAGIDLTIHGGYVGQFFGGSNQNGILSGELHTVVDNNGPCEGNLVIDEFFCGGNFVDINGDLETTISCSDGMNVNNLYGGCNMANISGHVVLNLCGGTYTNVYGGSKGDLVSLGSGHIDKQANIGGYVTLNLYGGTIENVYGGSNVNGNINGTVTVNVIDDEGDCPLYITNIYGGSNMTNYTPSNPNGMSPIVNLVHAKYGISGNVYGGSKGVEGTEVKVTSNPLVNIGYEATIMNQYLPSDYPTFIQNTLNNKPRAFVSGSVFGGGDAAKVEGNTAIFLRNRAKVFGNVYGGGNMGEVKDNPATTQVEGNTKVIVNGANQ